MASLSPRRPPMALYDSIACAGAWEGLAPTQVGTAPAGEGQCPVGCGYQLMKPLTSPRLQPCMKTVARDMSPAWRKQVTSPSWGDTRSHT